MDGNETALSFESSIGCEEFWRLICRFYGKSYEAWKLRPESEEELESEVTEDGEQDFYNEKLMNDIYEYEDLRKDPELPKIEIAFPEKPEICTLTEIEEGLYQSIMIPSLRRQISEILIQFLFVF